MSTRTHNHVIAVVGGSGAGKTWLVRQLCQLIGENACHLTLDDFYRDRSHLPMARRARVNFDVPRAIDWSGAARVLRDARAGLATEVPCYDFATYSRRGAGRRWEPRQVIFVDGLWLLRPAELRSLFDLKIYLDTPAGLRHERRVARDTVERGYTAQAVHERLMGTVLPMHDRYVEPQRRWADLILSQPYEEEQLAELAERLWRLLGPAGHLRAGDATAFHSELLSLTQHEYAN